MVEVTGEYSVCCATYFYTTSYLMMMMVEMLMWSLILYVFSEAHLTVLVLDLTTMRLRHFRKDIEINSEQLYQKCLRDDVVSVEVRLLIIDIIIIIILMP